MSRHLDFGDTLGRSGVSLGDFRAIQMLDLMGDGLVTAQALAARTGVSERTVYRYIGLLRKAGHTILSEAGAGYMLRRRAMPTGDIEMRTDAEWQARERELLEANNKLLERARTAEARCNGAGGQAVTETWDIEATAEEIACSLSAVKGGRFHGPTYNAAKAGALEAFKRAAASLSQPHPADERVAPTEGVTNKAEEGRQAYKGGQSKDCNPYPQGTARYWQWSSGWLDERAFRPRPDERAMEALTQIRKASALDAVVQAAPASAMARFAKIYQVADSTLVTLAGKQ